MFTFFPLIEVYCSNVWQKNRGGQHLAHVHARKNPNIFLEILVGRCLKVNNNSVHRQIDKLWNDNEWIVATISYFIVGTFHKTGGKKYSTWDNKSSHSYLGSWPGDEVRFKAFMCRVVVDKPRPSVFVLETATALRRLSHRYSYLRSMTNWSSTLML